MFACLAMASLANDTEIPGSKGVPDLTKGGELTRINERWAGPIGIYCGVWRPVQGRDNAHQAKYVRQLLVQEVEEGSPADGVLQQGDVILGADGTGAEEIPLFESAPWAMIPIANAIAAAEVRDPALLKLLIWRPAPKAEKNPPPCETAWPGRSWQP